ncbi:MAG: prepilin-type N-terminal cleavage/methylation domain-containing protein [Bdellovibrionota bacterium]
MRMKQRAFTLLELMMVMALLVLVARIALPQISTILALNMKSTVIKVVGFLEQAYGEATMGHKRIRLHFDMETGEYWAMNDAPVETFPLIDESTKLDEALAAMKKRVDEKPRTPEEIEAEKAKRFVDSTSGELEKKKLPNGIRFKGIINVSSGERFEGGPVDVDISASGLNPELIIQMEHDSGKTYSIVLPPITGKSRIESGAVDVSDL